MDVKSLIKKHEGYRGHIYLDSEGIPTVGWGHALHVGSHVPPLACSLIFEDDYRAAVHDYGRLSLELDPVRRAVILDMIFNLGLPRLLGFKKMLAALREGDFEKAAIEMVDSKWAGQVKGRADTLARMMRTGKE
jgi:lysozyme